MIASQIVERLRGFDVDSDLCNIAADEIEKLEEMATEQSEVIDDLFERLYKYITGNDYTEEGPNEDVPNMPGSDEWI